jgi:hypothetical protein
LYPSKSGGGHPAKFTRSRRTVCAWLLAAAAAPAIAARERLATIELGLDVAGYPTGRWIDAIRDRVDDATLASIKTTSLPLSLRDRAWLVALRRIAPRWSSKLPDLDVPFRGLASPPQRVIVLLGNQGGDDGFTSDPDTVALDLTALQQVYGDPAAHASDGAVKRLLSHEYTHLLIHPWLDRCGWTEAWAARTPFLHALRTLYNEGVAGLRSIEDPHWVSSDGILTPFARSTLDILQPRMVKRLTALANNPPPDVARSLLRNISQGNLTDKWGSVPIALWLAKASRFDAGRLHYYLRRKPDAILDLAVEGADRVYRSAFEQLRAAATAQIAAERITGSQ